MASVAFGYLRPRRRRDGKVGCIVISKKTTILIFILVGWSCFIYHRSQRAVISYGPDNIPLTTTTMQKVNEIADQSNASPSFAGLTLPLGGDDGVGGTEMMPLGRDGLSGSAEAEPDENRDDDHVNAPIAVDDHKKEVNDHFHDQGDIYIAANDDYQEHNNLSEFQQNQSNNHAQPLETEATQKPHTLSLNQTFIDHLQSLQPLLKKIHIFFPDKHYWRDASIPFVQHSILALMSLNPDWNINIYDDNDIDDIIRKAARGNLIPQEECDILLGEGQYSGNASHIVERSDIARLLVMYMDGGFYIDADKLISKKMSDVVHSNTKMCLPTSNDAHFAQDLMCTSPGNTLFLTIIQQTSNMRMRGGPGDKPLERMQGWVEGGALFDMGPVLYNVEILKMVFGLTQNDYYNHAGDETGKFYKTLRDTLFEVDDGLILTGIDIGCTNGLLVDETVGDCYDRSELYDKYGMTPWAVEVDARWKDK